MVIFRKDLDTNKVSMFGKKGYQSFVIEDTDTIKNFYSAAIAVQEPVKNEYTIFLMFSLSSFEIEFPASAFIVYVQRLFN